MSDQHPSESDPSQHSWPMTDVDHGEPRRDVQPSLVVRVAAPVLIVAMLAALVAFYARSHNSHTEDVAHDVISVQEQYRAASDAGEAVAIARAAAIEGLTGGNDAFVVAAQLVNRQADSLDEIVERVEALNLNNTLSEPLAALLASNRTFLDATGRMIDRALDNPETAEGSLNSNNDLYQQHLDEHRELRATFSSELTDLVERFDAQGERAGLMFPLLPIGLFLIGLALAWWAARSIVTPLHHVAETLDQIAQGHFSMRSNIGGSDELGRIGQATDQLAEQLGDRFSALTEDARRSTQNRMVYEALEIADSESATLTVAEQALGLVAPDSPGGLLLLDPKSGLLGEVAASPTSGPSACPVRDPSECFALRRGQTIVFDSSESINSCPMLRNRPSGPISAVCVPMTFNSSPLGVLHVTGPNHLPPDGSTSDQLIDLATQTATHLGSVRILEVTRQQASTDGMTGLFNRRVIEARVTRLLTHRTPFVLVLADLDRFKSINDRFGHEVGDRALQTFADVMDLNVRDSDLVGRLGGEEFILIYPELSITASMEAIARLRSGLVDSTGTADIPSFTASFGVTHSTVADDFDGVLRVADAGLLMAKQQGRDRAVYATPELADEVFNGRPETRG